MTQTTASAAHPRLALGAVLAALAGALAAPYTWIVVADLDALHVLLNTTGLLLLAWVWQRWPAAHGVWIALAFGLGLAVASAHWLAPALVLGLQHSWWLRGVLLAIGWGTVAVPWVLAGWARGRLAASALPAPAQAAGVSAALVVGYWLITYTPFSFPWGNPATVHAATPLGGWLPLLGSLALGGLILGAADAVFWPKAQRRWAAVLWVAVLGGGWAVQHMSYTQPQGAAVRVGVVQVRAPQREESIVPATERMSAMLGSALRISRGMVQHDDAQVIVWPEGAFPGREERARKWIGEVINNPQEPWAQVAWLLGADERWGAKPSDTEPAHNLVLAAGLNSSGHYKKQQLVPFIEGSPGWVGQFAQRATERLNITAGPAGQAPLQLAGLPVAAFVCSEGYQGGSLRRTGAQAAWLALLIDNSWFATSRVMPEQHLQHARLRAVEQRKWLAVASNIGPSAFISPQGQVVLRSKLGEVDKLTGTVQPMLGSTPYARWGDWPALALALLVLTAVFGWAALERRSRHGIRP